MLYVSKIDKVNNLVYVTDSDDGVVDAVSQHQLKEIVKLGVVIDGVTCVGEKLYVKVVRQVEDISGLIAKLTLFRNYKEYGCFRFNTEYNIGWVFKDAVGDDATFSPFKRKLETNSQVRLYVLPSVTKLESLFSECRVKSLDLSHFDTRNVTDMRSMFKNCEVEVLDLSSLDTSNVTDMHYMFDNCRVKSLDLSHFDTSKVVVMDDMFRDCRVESLNLSSFDTSSVEVMKHMFHGVRIKSLDLSNFDTSKVLDMHGMFCGCQVESLDISSFDTWCVLDMHEMFRGCRVESLDLSSFDTSNTTDMRKMFHDCQISRIIVNATKIIKQLGADGFSGKIIRA